MNTYIRDLLVDYSKLIWETLGPIIYIAGLVTAFVSNTPWLYIPVLALLFLLPAYHFAVAAFSGRSNRRTVSARATNILGTVLVALCALCLLMAFVGTLYIKLVD